MTEDWTKEVFSEPLQIVCVFYRFHAFNSLLLLSILFKQARIQTIIFARLIKASFKSSMNSASALTQNVKLWSIKTSKRHLCKKVEIQKESLNTF